MKNIGTGLVATLALIGLSGCLSATSAEGMKVTIDGQTEAVNQETDMVAPVTAPDYDAPERYDAQSESLHGSSDDSGTESAATP